MIHNASWIVSREFYKWRIPTVLANKHTVLFFFWVVKMVNYKFTHSHSDIYKIFMLNNERHIISLWLMQMMCSNKPHDTLVLCFLFFSGFFSAAHLAYLPFSDLYLSKIEDLKIKFCWCYFIWCCSTLPTSQFQFLPGAYQWMSGARLSSVVWRIGKVLRWTPSCLPRLHPSTPTWLISAALFAAGGIRTDCPLQPTLTCTFLGSGQTDTWPYQP